MSDPKSVDLYATERETDLLIEAAHPSRPDRYKLVHQHIERIKVAARREALLEAAEHCTNRANEAHRCDLHVVSDTWDVAAVDLRALAEPERDEESGR